MRRANTASRWYGGLIAVVSGFYAISMGVWGPGMNYADWFMLVLGGIVLGHGVALFGRFSRSLDASSGVFMIIYSVLMLLGQAWAGMVASTRMMDSMGGQMGEMGGQMMGWSTMAWDPGMTALAVVMLGSGIIMTAMNDNGS